MKHIFLTSAILIAFTSFANSNPPDTLGNKTLDEVIVTATEHTAT